MTGADRYTPAAQAFHWLSALLVVLAWTLGVSLESLPKGAPRDLAELVHLFAGQAIVALLCLRLIWRFIAPARHEPTPAGPLVDALGKFVHLVLYALLIAVPASGLVTLFLAGEALPLAGLVDIASPWPANRELKHYAEEIHETLAHGLALLASIHALAAIGHHCWLKDGVLKRMLPKAIS